MHRKSHTPAFHKGFNPKNNEERQHLRGHKCFPSDENKGITVNLVSVCCTRMCFKLRHRIS